MATIQCPNCQKATDSAARFCTHCGASTEPYVRCGACSQLQPVSNHYCMQCGAELTGAAWASPPPAASAIVDGVWKRGPDEFVRRVDPEEARSFLGNRVVRVPPGLVGVVVVDGVVDRVLPPGQQTTLSLFQRIANFFKGGDRTAFYLVDLRPIPIPFTVATRLSPGGRTLQTQVLVSFFVERFERDRLGAFLANAVGTRAVFGANDLYQALRPEVTQVATVALERLASRGELRWADAEAEVRRELTQRIADRWSLAVVVTVAPLAATTTLDLHLGVSRGARVRACGRCGAQLTITMKFCDRCGTAQDALTRSEARPAPDARALPAGTGETPALVTSDGGEMEIDLVVRVRGQDDALDRDALSDALASAAASHLRSVTVAQLASGGGFAALEEAMRDKAATLIVAAGLELLSLGVVDVRSVEGQWLLGARADLNRAADEVRVGRAWLAQGRDEVDLLGLTLAQAVARQAVERSAKLDGLKQELGLDQRERALREGDALAKEQEKVAARQHAEPVRSANAELDVAEARRAAARDKDVTEAHRATERVVAAGRREDEMEELQHGMSKEAAARDHTGTLESRDVRRRVDDATYDARARADVAQHLADREQARQLEKLRAMAELDATMAAQEHEQKKELRATLAGLDEKRAIAVQATELAKTEGGGAAWAAALASKGDLEAADKRLEQAEQHAKEMREVLEKQADRLERIAERGTATDLYARSLDAMAKVAASRAAPEAVVAAVAAPSAANTPCPTCGASLRPEARFCGACGQTRTP